MAMSLFEQVNDVVSEAWRQVIEPSFVPERCVRTTADPVRGDMQSDVALMVSKKVGASPKELADKVVELLSTSELFDRVEVAHPGFVNLVVAGHALIQVVDHPSVPLPTLRPRLVIDYSSPNVAKEMHVGHLRSTIIGDVLARLFETQGYDVVRQNHLGDWGTQFGMLIELLFESQQGEVEQSLSDLNRFYQQAKARFDADLDFQERARLRVVALQSGDEPTLAAWRRLVTVSEQHFQEAYQRLKIDLCPEHLRPESSYNADLPGIVEALRQKGLLVESDGAQCVFPPGFVDADQKPLPFIVQKADGGYLYATTDLAALRYRIEVLKADRLVYVTDNRQMQHFAMLFAVARMAGWLPEHVRVDHVPFGVILGEDKKPFKTRSGETIKLAHLIDEATTRAQALISSREEGGVRTSPEEIAEAVGVSAIKYADLKNEVRKDYVFSWDRLISLTGNTAPYLQYVGARLCALQAKASTVSTGPLLATLTPEEHALLMHLALWPEVLREAAERLEPHHIATWTFELSTRFNQFYERCPILSASSPALVEHRLALVAHTKTYLEHAFHLLGVTFLERM